MHLRSKFFAVCCLGPLLAIAACAGPQPTRDAASWTKDPHSFARPNDVVVEHLELDLSVDFEQRMLRGRASLRLSPHAGHTTLWLDSSDLAIHSVYLDDDPEAVSFQVGEPVPFLGSALQIPIEEGTKTVHIDYSSAPSASALLWLEPEQTLEGEGPFVFSQSQTIFARSWIPIQDSPGIRFTYDATLRVPQGLMALMSAENPTELSDDGVYHFTMPEPIPAYLVAIAVGKLAFAPLDERSGVYAEPGMLESCAWEFADTPAMIDVVEELYGPYAWGRFDLLILPPYFPFGGMENPRLTFATPTIVAGDRSLVSLIAHELAHSWSGNLITNSTWDDFWLNEGFTVYLERRIMEEIEGPVYSGMLEQIGLGDLHADMNKFGEDSVYNHLKYDLAGLDPEVAFSDVAYEKGYFFLRTIEEEVGRERFDAFLKSYFSEFAFGSMDTARFLSFLTEQLFADDAAGLQRVRIEDWVFGPSLPSNSPAPRDGAFDVVRSTTAAFLDRAAAEELSVEDWTTHHWLEFLRGLSGKVDAGAMAKLDARFQLSASQNAEIKHAWFMLAVDAWYEPALGPMEEFLVGMGRRKFLSPLYQALSETEPGMELARNIYARCRVNYHPIAVRSIDTILGIEP